MRAALAILPLALAACTSSAGGGDCAAIGMTNSGTMTATTPDGPFEAECVTAFETDTPSGMVLMITGVESPGVLEGVQPRTVNVMLQGDATGTYSGGPGSGASVSYTAGDSGDTDLSNRDRRSVFVLEESSPRLRGSFEFRDGRVPEHADVPVTGSFDVVR